MAFRASPSPFGGLGASQGEPQPQTGPDLEEIQTEAIGFQAIAGEAKLRLLPSPWPADSLPPPTASLLSVASNKGLLAAAGPESVIVASTDSVRQAFSAASDGNIKPFTPQLTLPLGMRISQVAFSTDDNFLVLSAENGGGLAVYETQSLMQGNTQTAFELATNGTALRSLLPNPTLEKAELFAAVLTNGELMIADLKNRSFIVGNQRQTLKTGVSCVSWSNKGKQLVAGLGDGSLYQMKPEGEGTGNVPKPPGMEGDEHVSSVSWLENDVFLVAYTPSTPGEDPMQIPATLYHLITRYPKQSPPSTVYQKMSELVGPFGLPRTPACQFIRRLRNFPPALEDAILVASTVSPDIGMITRSKLPLSNDAPAEKISNTFTVTAMAEDSRRAQMPMSEDMSDTSPIGVGLDLSSKDKVERPLPNEEFDASQGPLPALMILNNEGLLSLWWFVYAGSIRQGTTYPGLVAAGGVQSQQQSESRIQASPFASAGQQNAPAFGQNSFGTTTPSVSPFANSKLSAFGSGAAPGPSFGAPSALGKSGSPFGGAQSSKPSGPSAQGTAFGVVGGLGHRSSPWGTAPESTSTTSGSAFGQSGFSAPKATPFGAFANSGSTGNASGGFSSFASKPSPFMSAGSGGGTGNAFGGPATTAPPESSMDTDTSFGAPVKSAIVGAKAPFGSGAFTLGSTFQKDPSVTEDQSKPTGSAGDSFFGSGFGDALGTAQKDVQTSQTKDADMDEDDAPADNGQEASAGQDTTAPTTTSAPIKPSFPTVNEPPKVGGLFGTQAQIKVTPAAVASSQPTGFTFGTSTKSKQETTTPRDTPRKADEPQPSIEASPKIKEEPQSDDDDGDRPLSDHKAGPRLASNPLETPRASKSPEAPLPPESTSKTSFAPGDSSNSSKSSDDAPLPPDFMPSKTKLKQVEAAPPKETGLPSEEEEESEGLIDHGSYSGEDERSDEESGNLDEEGSGVDVAQEISPTTDPNQSPKMTPGSSFGVTHEKSLPGGLFGRVTGPAERPKADPPLFGEVAKTSAPYLPPPNKIQQSPRSPSPVRSNRLGDSLRPDNARSISAPGPFQAVSHGRAPPSRVVIPAKPQPSFKDLREQSQQEALAAKAEKEREEAQELDDDEDARVRAELESEIVPTLDLDPFLAHQDYVGDDVKPGIPGQIEKVYRDINSMIDTLGLNARSLTAFSIGHQENKKKDGAWTRSDLEHDDWRLAEVAVLPVIEGDISQKLDYGRVSNAQGISDECRNIRKEMTVLRAKGADIVRAVDVDADPKEAESAKHAPLSMDQATQQYEIRKKLTNFQKLLAEGEENVSMLRAKLASCESRNGKDPQVRQPTVEAITNTIKKMTNIAKTKVGDIESLENEMQQLGFSPVATLRSREGSPFTPVSPKRKSVSQWGASINGYHHSPTRSSLLGRSVNGESSLRKSMTDEAEEYRDKARRRREINELIRSEFEKKGPRIRPLD